MRRFFLTVCTVVLGWATTTAAQTVEDTVAQCARETGAPGAYTVDGSRVAPGEGGTSVGARNVADCLLDKRAVQFGVTPAGAAAPAVVASNKTAEECRRTRNQQITTGLVLTAGVVYALGGTDGSVIGGVTGSVLGIQGVNERFRDCVAAAQTIDSSRAVTVIGGCGQGASPLRGGNGYCH